MPRLPEQRIVSLISVEGLEIRQGGRQILHDVTLAVRKGEIVTIVGPNGSGKSTLLRAMIGAIRPSAGRVVRQEGLRIGYVPQSLPVDRNLPLTVRRFLSLPKPVSDSAAKSALTVPVFRKWHAHSLARYRGGRCNGFFWPAPC